MNVPEPVTSFAKLLRAADIRQPLVLFGEIRIEGCHADIASLKYNKKPWELLAGSHDYKLIVGSQDVEVSAQLYLNENSHYRLFLYSRCGKAKGMLFSVNLTISEQEGGFIWLGQKISFKEGQGKGLRATEIRTAKTRLFADMLVRCGILVSDNYEVELGMFDSNRGVLLNTTPSNLVRTFMTVGLIKGHFAGNKGYQFSCIPRFDNSFEWHWDTTEQVRTRLQPNRRGYKVARSVPRALRYNVLERDKGVCCLCGRSPRDGVTLHVDHIKPFSLGGLTTLGNLQTLCADCNIGKSNRSSTDFR